MSALIMLLQLTKTSFDLIEFCSLLLSLIIVSTLYDPASKNLNSPFKVQNYSPSVPYCNCRSVQPQFKEAESRFIPDAQLCTAVNRVQSPT